MNERFTQFRTAESRQRGLAFKPHPTDVFISPYSKSGTTWIQQIVHCLRTGGSMDFDDISRVIPWLESAYDLGIDLNAPQAAKPRAFKSHLPWHDIPKGGRYIYSFRNPENVLVSMYFFFEGWFFEPGSIRFDTFARERFMQGTLPGSVWNHIVSWWEQRHNPNVLILCFEDMLDNPRETVETIAKFLKIEATPELIDLTVHNSSKSFMQTHREKFDEHLFRSFRDAPMGLPSDTVVTKVRDRKKDAMIAQQLAGVREALAEIWTNIVGARFGFKNYEALRDALAALDQSTKL